MARCSAPTKEYLYTEIATRYVFSSIKITLGSSLDERKAACAGVRSRVKEPPQIATQGAHGFVIVSNPSYVPTLTNAAASDFDKVRVPKWARQFDVYESDHLGSSHTVVTRPTDDTKGKSFLARLYIGRLGPWSDVQRALSSKHRVLYIGTMPEV